MSFNGSGTFVINSTGQPVVTATVISSSTFNSLTADLGTGLSTAITKDGQTTTTAKIPFAQGISAAVASNFAAGTVGAPSIYLSTDTTTGLYRIGANNDGFAISGVKLLDLGSALVGITGALTVSTTLGVTGITTLGAALVGPASATVFNTVSTTVNAFGAATTLNIGSASTTAGTVYLPTVNVAANLTGLGYVRSNKQSDTPGAAGMNLYMASSGLREGTAGDVNIDTFNGASFGSRLSVSAAGLVAIAGAATVGTTLGVSGAQTNAASVTGLYTGLTISNTGAAVTDHAQITIKTSGSGGGDPLLYFLSTSEADWVMGLDNSDSNKFKIAVGGTLGSGSNDALIITSGAPGGVTIPGTLGVTGTSTLAAVNASGDVVSSRSQAGGGVVLGSTNTSSSANSYALVGATTTGAASGANDPYFLAYNASVGAWAFGLDTSAALFKISNSTSLGTNDAITIGAGASPAVTIPGTLGVTGLISGSKAASTVQFTTARASSGVGEQSGYEFAQWNSSSALVTYAGVVNEIVANTAGSHTGKMIFSVAGSGSVAERMNLSSTGLTVTGGVEATGLINSTLAESNSAGSGQIKINPIAAATGWTFRQNTSHDLVMDFFSGSWSAYHTFSSTGLTVTGTGSFTGNLFAGKTSVSIGTTGFSAESTGVTQIVVNGATPVYINRLTSDGTLIEFRQDGNPEGSISVSGSTVSYNTTSDYRAKDITGKYEASGETIDQLQVYLGMMKGATIARPMMIAHEAASVVPYAVTGEKDAEDEDGKPIYQSMDHQIFVPLLIAEVQNLRSRVALLESK